LAFFLLVFFFGIYEGNYFSFFWGELKFGHAQKDEKMNYIFDTIKKIVPNKKV
jgi:hypothetical protein